MARKKQEAATELSLIEKVAKELKLNKNQVKALEEYEKLYGNLELIVRNKSAYQLGNNLRSKELIRLYFKEV